MWDFFNTSLRILAEHPKAGAMATLLTMLAAATGYWWGSSTFVYRVELDRALQEHKTELVETIDKRIIRRDMETKEETLRQYTQMIRLGLCPRDDCAYTEAEKETLERQIEALRRKL